MPDSPDPNSPLRLSSKGELIFESVRFSIFSFGSPLGLTISLCGFRPGNGVPLRDRAPGFLFETMVVAPDLPVLCRFFRVPRAFVRPEFSIALIFYYKFAEIRIRSVSCFPPLLAFAFS